MGNDYAMPDAEPTRFVESNALLAVQIGNDSHALDILNDMFPGELRDLYLAAERLARLARIVREAKDPAMSSMEYASDL